MSHRVALGGRSRAATDLLLAVVVAFVMLFSLCDECGGEPRARCSLVERFACPRIACGASLLMGARSEAADRSSRSD